MAEKDDDVQSIAKHYMKYLNGPLGHGVMSSLKEGESCTLRTHDRVLKITRKEGRAVVQILEPTNDTRTIQGNYVK